MKKTYSFILLSCLFGYAYTQTSFYIKPTLNNKIFISNVNNLFSLHTIENSIDNNSFLENPYFKAINVKFSTRPNYNFGLYFGVSLKNKKHLFEIGITEDATGSYFKSQYMEYKKLTINDSLIVHYSQNELGYSSSLFTYRYSLKYCLRLNKAMNKNIISYATIGGGIIINRRYPNQEDIQFSNFKPTYSHEFAGNKYIDENTYIYKRYDYGYATIKYSGYINIGISTDFYSKKGKQILSASLYYLHGFKPIELSYHDIYIMDKGVRKLFSYCTTSNGSGIYFQLARRFQFHPRILKIKNK